MTPDTLRTLRKQAGLTQAELAERLHMSLRGVQELESGATQIRGLHVLALSAIGLGDPPSPARAAAALAARRVLYWDQEIDLQERAGVLIRNGDLVLRTRRADGQALDDAEETLRQNQVLLEAAREARALWAGVAGVADD